MMIIESYYVVSTFTGMLISGTLGSMMVAFGIITMAWVQIIKIKAQLRRK